MILLRFAQNSRRWPIDGLESFFQLHGQRKTVRSMMLLKRKETFTRLFTGTQIILTWRLFVELSRIQELKAPSALKLRWYYIWRRESSPSSVRDWCIRRIRFHCFHML